MSDEPVWRRAITGASERLASALGLKKSKPVTGAAFQDLTPDRKSKAVRDVLKLSDPDAKATAIASLARELGNMERPKDRSSVIDAAIKNVGAKGRLGVMGRSAIVSARDHLQPKHQSKLIKIVRRSPKLNELINNEINNVEKFKESREFLKDASRGRTNNEHKTTAGLMREIDEQKARAELTRKTDEQKARAGLMNSVRGRDDRVL